jgi:PAS domain S-box-containing protein
MLSYCDRFHFFVDQITDSQDKFIYGNVSGEKVLGFSQSELIDRNLWDLQSPVGLSEMVLCENDSVRVPL